MGLYILLIFRLLDRIKFDIKIDSTIVDMNQKKLKRIPYQYPVFVLGSRRHNDNDISSYKNLNDVTLEMSNSSIEKDNLIVLNAELDTSVSRWKRTTFDLAGAASGYGSHSYCPEGIPLETALFSVLGAAALSFGILFMAITMITMMGKRRRREIYSYDPTQIEAPLQYSGMLSDLLYQGSFLYRHFRK